MSQRASWITAEALAEQIGGPHAPRIVDVRRRQAYEAGDRVIAGSSWRDHARVQQWANEIDPARPVVLYCVHGHQVSQSAAAVLRAMGYRAGSLRGGLEAFIAAGGPTVARRPGVHDAHRPSRWVTRERPKIDRLACPWLIRRFIDPAAHILYVAADQVIPVAEECGATAFDVEGVELSHVDEHCSFDAFLRLFAIEAPALDQVARIVRGADTARLELAPECAGLLALSLGISSLHTDDLRAMEQAFGVYDALYAWARNARDEVHGWPPSRRIEVR